MAKIAKRPLPALTSNSSFPVGTILYTTRRSEMVAANLPDGTSLVIVNRGDLQPTAERKPRIFDPYGIAHDRATNLFWVADKFTDTVYSIRFGLYEQVKTSDARIEQVKAHPSPLISDPCTLDCSSEHGLLLGCHGKTGSDGGVLRYIGSKWSFLTHADCRGGVSHCCWLPDGHYVYISRSDSILWEGALGTSATALTLPTRLCLCQMTGDLSQLRLRYVQGLFYSVRRSALLIADASLGCVFEVDLGTKKYRVLFGKPTISDSNSVANVQPGNADRWLGWIRAIAENSDGDIVWLDGEQRRLMKYTKDCKIEILGVALADSLFGMAGSQLVIL